MNKDYRVNGYNGHNDNNGNEHNGQSMNDNSSHNGHDHDLLVAVEDKLRSDDFLHAYQLDLPPVDHARVEAATVELLEAVGEDPQREGLLNTPKRVARAYEELLSGYRTDPAKLVNGAIFNVEYDDMVIVRDIEYFSICEHHMLPFVGHAHVAYVPNRKVIGLSKIPRIVDMFSRRLQVQERLTRQIADFVNEVLQPQGVAVVMDGVHMCSKMRGVEKHDSSMTTSAMLGIFREDADLRRDLIAQLSRPTRDTLSKSSFIP